MTLTFNVKISKDLKNATVFYSHFGSEKEQKKSHEKLNKATRFFHDELNKTIRLKQIPSLIFKRTTHLEKGSNILSKINSLSNESTNT